MGSESEGAETVELAVLMGELQRHSMKLGYAVAGRNQPLAAFYLHEIEEVQEDLMAIGEHEGMPIGSTTRIILAPTLEALEATLGQGNWDRDWQRYEAVIQACNRCHQATEHGFVEILPAQGEPPYNQRFAAPADP